MELWRAVRSGGSLTALMNFSDRGHLEPKLLVCSVMFSLVCESNVGFSISAFTNTQIWFFTWMDAGRKKVNKVMTSCTIHTHTHTHTQSSANSIRVCV